MNDLGGRVKLPYWSVAGVGESTIIVPRARNSALRRITLEALEVALADARLELTPEAVAEFRHRFDRGLAPAIGTPRAAKRYASAAAFALPLLKGEANPVDILTIEGIHALFPSLYEAIRANQDGFLRPVPMFGQETQQQKDLARERIEKSFPADGERQTELRELVQFTFPRTGALWTNSHYGADWDQEWASTQRISSPEYFDRYFSYSISTEEVGDAELTELLSEPNSIEDRFVALVAAKGSEGLELLLRKLDRRVELLTPEQNAGLRRGLLALGPLVAEGPVPRLFRFSGQGEASRLIATLIHQLPAEHRAASAEHIVETGEPLGFAFEVLRWMNARITAGSDERILSAESVNELKSQLARRLRNFVEAKRMPVWRADKLGLSLAFLARDSGERDWIRSHVRDTLQATPHEAVSLLLELAGQMWSGSTGLPHQDDFNTNDYDSLGSLVDPQVVVDAIAEILPEATAAADYQLVEDAENVELAVARQFVVLHRRSTEAEPE